MFDDVLLERIRKIEPTPFEGTVFRIVRTGVPPERENILGARWNPPDTAIYTALEAATARAEIAFRIGLEPFPMKAIPRSEFRVQLRLDRVVRLMEDGQLATVGISNFELVNLDYTACQAVGGAVASLGNDGLMVPSARTAGMNLVIYPTNPGASYRFQVISETGIRFEI